MWLVFTAALAGWPAAPTGPSFFETRDFNVGPQAGTVVRRTADGSVVLMVGADWPRSEFVLVTREGGRLRTSAADLDGLELATRDVNGDGVDELLEFDGSELRVELGGTLRVQSFPGSSSTYGKVDMVDIDLDGTLELVVAEDRTLWVHRAGAWHDVPSQWTPETPSFTLAQLDSDPQLELAMGGGTVVDGSTLQIETQLPHHLHAGFAIDSDSDGIEEVVGWNGDTLVSADTSGIRWSIDAPTDAEHHAASFTVDGQETIVVCAGLQGSMMALDPITGLVRRSLPNPPGATSCRGLLPWDSDLDGQDELLIMRPGQLVLVDSHFDLVASTGMAGEIEHVDAGDVDGDGRDDLVVTSHHGVTVYSADMDILAMARPPSPLHSVDLEGDGEHTLVSLEQDLVQQWTLTPRRGLRAGAAVPLPPASSVWIPPQFADVNGDGADDLMVDGDVGTWAFDPRTGWPLWVDVGRSVATSRRLVADVDGDGTPEVVLSDSLTASRVLHGPSGTVEAVLPHPQSSVQQLGSRLLFGQARLGTVAIYDFDGVDWVPGFAGLSPLPVPSDRWEVVDDWVWMRADGLLQWLSLVDGTLVEGPRLPDARIAPADHFVAVGLGDELVVWPR